MAVSLRLKITGLSELRHAIARYGDALVAEAVGAVDEAVRSTIAAAERAAPVGVYPVDWRRPDGGRLRASFKGAIRTDGYMVRGRVYTSSAVKAYAGVVHFGSRRIKKAQPYLVPAAIVARRRMRERLARAVVALAPEGLGTPRIVPGPGEG